MPTTPLEVLDAGMASPLTPAMAEALRQELLKDERIWMAAQLAGWVAAPFGVRLTPCSVVCPGNPGAFRPAGTAEVSPALQRWEGGVE